MDQVAELWSEHELRQADWEPESSDFRDFVSWNGRYSPVFPPKTNLAYEHHKAVVKSLRPVGAGPDQYLVEFETENKLFSFSVPRPYMAMLFSMVVLNENLMSRRNSARLATSEPAPSPGYSKS